MFRNIIKSLDEHAISIVKENILKYYELYIEHFHKDIKKYDKNNIKKLPLINEEQDKIIIEIIKEELNKEKAQKEKMKKEKEKTKQKESNITKNKKLKDNFEIDDEELEAE